MESRRYYYWLYKEVDGKPYLIYGGETEEEAQQKGLEELGTDFRIKRLPTRNIGTASSLMKGNRLEITRDLRQASRRMRHKRVRRNNVYDDNA